ncbi:DUF1987 domain-containing protein [Brevibacillus sp. SYSU BS000544]|uniref:DUF1987 domain-containing protein n=1 Tax=Brevibacillus sp. SYSU BS000544 TaxID=3416443 RepID=UPI003CE52E57
MSNLIIHETKSTPGIYFDTLTNTLQIKGQSYPENAFAFYQPVFDWVNEFLDELNNSTIIEIQLAFPYINTSSTKCLMVLLDRFDQAFQEGKQIRINWYVNEENENELECAEEFKEDLSLPFEIIVRGEE